MTRRLSEQNRHFLTAKRRIDSLSSKLSREEDLQASELAGDSVGVTDTASLTVSDGSRSLVDGEIELIDASAGDVTATLPSPSEGLFVVVKRLDSQTVSGTTVTIDTPGSQTIDDNSTLTLGAENATAVITSDGSDYYLI